MECDHLNKLLSSNLMLNKLVHLSNEILGTLLERVNYFDALELKARKPSRVTHS